MRSKIGERREQTGFTLIELLIALVIMGILTAIAYPQYTNHIRETRRIDAQIALNQTAAKLEKYLFQCNTYKTPLYNAAKTPMKCPDSGEPTLGFTDNLSPERHYVIALDTTKTSDGILCAGGSDSCYTLTASIVATGGGSSGRGTGKQQQDRFDCTTFTLDSRGVRNSTGNSTKCWGKK